MTTEKWWDRGDETTTGPNGMLHRRVPEAQLLEEGLWAALFPVFGPRSGDDSVAVEQIHQAMEHIRNHVAAALELGAREGVRAEQSEWLPAQGYGK